MLSWLRRRSKPQSTEVVYALIRVWNRPLHLWACLDSLYRATRHPCRFVAVDNASDDPLTSQVLQGFERRGMFHRLHRMQRNHAENQVEVWNEHRSQMGPFVILLDADVAVEPIQPCWLARLVELAERNPSYGLLGCLVDKSDFVDPEWARSQAPELDAQMLSQLIKQRSPERRQPERPLQEIIRPYPPAGRLLLARTEMLDTIGLRIGNRALCRAAEEAGWKVGIATSVRHRHLSLLNFFDYPDYDFDRLAAYLEGS